MRPSNRANNDLHGSKPSWFYPARTCPLPSWLRVADAPRPVRIILADDSRGGVAERLNLLEGGKRFRCNFIEPGLVSYADCGGDMELLRKETIEKHLRTKVGNPLTIGHVRTNKLVASTEVHGRVDNVGYDDKTGWFFCEGTVDTDAAREKIRNGWRPSTGYRVNGFGPGGVHHNIPYAQELASIEFHHLAIVENPRYEGASYRLNAKTQKTTAMNPLKWFRKIVKPAAEAGAAATETVETGSFPADATVEIDGKPVRMNELVDAHKAALAAAAPAKVDDEARENTLTGDDEVEVDGTKVKVAALVTSYRSQAAAVRENAKQAAAKTAAEVDARKNEGNQSFRVLSGARAQPVADVPERANSSNSTQEQLARGADRYGSGKN